MGRVLIALPALARLIFVAVLVAAIAWPGELVAQQASDAYGYDYQARTFNGLYENADRDATNNTGDQTLLRMEWSDLLNLANAQSSPVGAWVTNFQKGTYVGADGRTYRWSYSVKLVFNGAVFTIDQETYLDAGSSTTVHHRPPVLPKAP